MKLESVVLNDFFSILNDIDANYCVMNNYINMPEVIPSDVDIAVDTTIYNMLDSLVEALAKKHNIYITQKIWHGYNKCAYILSPIEISDYFWLQLDFFVDFSGKGFPNLLPSYEMLNNKKKYKNFYIPKAKIEVPFIIERRIFKNDIEDKHMKILFNLYQENKEDVTAGVIKIFDYEIGTLLIECIKKQNIDIFKINFKSLRMQLQKISQNNTTLLYRLSYIYWQGIRTLYRLYYPTGLSIVFMGNDTITKRNFIKTFNEKISGSFHGEKFYNPENFSDYFKLILNDFWARVTKKKTLWNIDKKKLNFNILKYCLYQDVIIEFIELDNKIKVCNISLEIDENDLINRREKVLQACLSYSLEKQVHNTSKHLHSILSPTSKKGFL